MTCHIFWIFKFGMQIGPVETVQQTFFFGSDCFVRKSIRKSKSSRLYRGHDMRYCFHQHPNSKNKIYGSRNISIGSILTELSGKPGDVSAAHHRQQLSEGLELSEVSCTSVLLNTFKASTFVVQSWSPYQREESKKEVLCHLTSQHL